MFTRIGKATRKYGFVIRCTLDKLRTFKVRLFCDMSVAYPSSIRCIQPAVLTLLHVAINTQFFLRVCLRATGRFREVVRENPCCSQEPSLGSPAHNHSFYCLKSPISKNTKPWT